MLLRRLSRATSWALLTTALLAPAARAADDVSGLSPQEVVSRFVAGVNARDPAAQKCVLLTAGLRDLLVAPRWVGVDPRLPEAYSDENRLRSCDFFVDHLPARRVVDRTGGIMHPAGARIRAPACTAA